MHSHCEGEVWGLDVTSGGSGILTSGDDNQVIFWDIDQRRRVKSVKVSDRKESSKRGKASTLSNHPASQCSRAVAADPDWIAVAANDGSVSIRSSASPSKEEVLLQDSEEWIEVMAFSPDHSMLAVGSHDNNIYIYDAYNFKLQAKLRGHTSYIMALDWSDDSNYIRSNCGAYELLFFS